METRTDSPAGRNPGVAPNDRPRLIARAAAVGLSTLALGLAVHAASGGAVPAVPILLALAALAVLAATLIAQAHPPIWAVLLLLGVAQQVLHWTLGGLGGASASLSGGAGHHGGEVPLRVAAGQAHSPEVMLMLHTHLAVALLLGWTVAWYPRITGWVSARRKRERTVRAEEGAPVA